MGISFKKKKPSFAKYWDYEKNVISPADVTYGSNKKYWFKCQNKHEFEDSPKFLTRRNTFCRICEFEENRLDRKYPNIIKIWDSEKNNEPPSNFTYGTHKKAWFKCTNGHSSFVSIKERTVGKYGCPYCKGSFVGDDNNLAYLYPKIAKEWNYEKNKKGPEEYKPGSSYKAFWICKKGHKWQAQIFSRVKRGDGCSFCSPYGKGVTKENNLKVNNPKIAKEWDYEKNKKGPEEYRANSRSKVYWICKKRHSYEATIGERNPSNRRGTGCPYCDNKLVTSENNLAYLYPKIAKEWDYKKNKDTPDKVTSNSSLRRWWVCKYGHSWDTVIATRTPTKVGKGEPRGCPYCILTPRSKEEIYLLFELKEFFTISENDHKIKLKRINDVDIILRQEKIVIEFDGAYWHKDKAERDKVKTNNLRKAGWTVIRVREKPLKILSRKYNVSAKSGSYKETANKVLKKLNLLGFQVNGLDSYIERKTLKNKKNADKYIEKLLKEKSSVA